MEDSREARGVVEGVTGAARQRLAESVSEARQAQGLSLRGLAALTGGIVTHDTISRIEAGEDTRFSSVLAVLTALGLNAADVLGAEPAGV